MKTNQINIDLDPVLVEALIPVLLDKLLKAESLIKQRDQEVNFLTRELFEKQEEHKEAVELFERLYVTYEKLIQNQPSDKAKEANVDPNANSNLMLYGGKHGDAIESKETFRFWKEADFMGWREYVKFFLDQSKEFLSLSNLMDFTNELDMDERRRLESSISNALSTLVSRKQIGTIQIFGFQGRFYGSLSIFENEWPKQEPLNKLQTRLNLNSIELTDVVFPGGGDDTRTKADRMKTLFE